jgi:epoxyqueuosine reductase
MEPVIQQLYTQLEQHGFKGRAVSIQRLQDLQGEIEGRHAQGQFDAEFYQERLTRFAFGPPDDFLAASSLIVVAVPRPQTQVTFTWKGTTRALVLPPTYAGYQETAQHMGDLLAGWLAPAGYRVAPARLPLKALAVRGGLGDYGRNNICYVPGMGSFFQLTAFYSDLPVQGDDWREPHMMDACQTCQACLRHCPTRAIISDRFLLHAERCIVFHNERPPEYPFPAWIDPAAHHCLVGCMRCQGFCPENKPFLEWIEGDEVFSEEETALLLAGATPDRLPAATVTKLERLELLDSLDTLPRNLGVFFSG